jgi:hypothetical protein
LEGDPPARNDRDRRESYRVGLARFVPESEIDQGRVASIVVVPGLNDPGDVGERDSQIEALVLSVGPQRQTEVSVFNPKPTFSSRPF